MAILAIEGFENYADATDVDSSTENFMSTSASGTIAAGRVSGSSFNMNINSRDLYIYLSSDSTATLWGGFGFKTNNTLSSRNLCKFFADGTITFENLTIALDSFGQLYIARGATILGTSSIILADDTWYYVEFKILFDNSVGTIDLWVDGNNEITGTGLDTIDTSGSATVRRVVFEGNSTNTNFFDDIVIGDTSGTDATDNIGEVVIEQVLIDGAGSSTQFTPSAGSNFQNVDDANPDDGTTYNSSSTAGHKDLFTTASLSGSVNTIYAVGIHTKAQKDEAGYRTLRSKVKTGVTEGNGTTRPLHNSNYLYFWDIFENDPDTGVAWTESGFNACEIGYEIVS